MSEPYLIVFSGPAGSGKTTQAKALSSALSLPYFDYDTLVQPFLLGIEHRYGLIEGSRSAFYKEWRSESYSTLLEVTKENLKSGISLVLSAPFTREMEEKDFFSRLKEESGASFRSIAFSFFPSSALRLKMLRQRGSYRDEEIINGALEYAEYSVKKAIWDADFVYNIYFEDYTDLPDRIMEKVREKCPELMKRKGGQAPS